MIDSQTQSLMPDAQAALHIHALWSDSQAKHGSATGFDSLLHTMRTRFNVTTAMLTLLGDEGTVAKAFAGTDPLALSHAAVLHACLSANALEDVFVFDGLKTPAPKPAPEHDGGPADIVFYASAPLVDRPGGIPMGSLALFGTRPKTFAADDRQLLVSLALAASAALVMPHNPAAATALALASKTSVMLLDTEQVLEAVNPRFTELTGFTSKTLAYVGVQELLCLDRLHGGASLISHALMAEVPACGMTRCHTRQGGTLPVEVFVFPLCDQRQRTLKTVLLIAPLFSGPIENFLLSLRSTERAELLSLHIDGLWAVDAAGKILKLSGVPIAHLDPSTHPALLGKLLRDAGVFDAQQTDWRDFYQSLSQDEVPAKLECCVTHSGQSKWYMMKGFRQSAANGLTTGYHGSFLDITESKLRELSLRRSEERLSLILKGANDGAWDWDLETGTYYLSPQWWAVMGRAPDSQLASAETWMEFIHPDDRQVVRDAFSHAVARGRDAYQSEFRLLHQRGHYIPVLGRGHILRNAAGKPVRTSGSNVDLTEQRQAQSQIRLLQSCVESLQDVVIVTHASPRSSPGPIIAYVNPAFERFTGYSAAEAIGKTPRLLQGPLTSRHELDKISAALQRWQPVKVELVNYKKSGDLFWSELEITPVQADGSERFTHWIGVQRDITQRKLAEQALHATTERLTLAIEASRLGLWTRHVAEDFGYSDARWYAMLGYAPGDQPETSTHWLQFVHPEDVALIQAQEKKAMASGDSSFEHEFRMRHASGQWVWIYSRGRVIERDAAGQPLVIAGTHMDITARIQAQQATERHNAQLSRCLEHLNVGVILQRHGVIKFVNSTLLGIFGEPSRDNIVGTRFSQYILPGDLDAAVWRQQQLMAGATPPPFWFNCIHRDGRVFKALTSSTVIEWEGEPHILSTMTPPGDAALLAQEIEATRIRYESLLAQQIEAGQVRIAHELHDSLGSQLAAMSLQVAGIKASGEDGKPFAKEADQLIENIKKAAEITRDLARGLSPVDAWPGAFWRALEKLCHEFSRSDGLQCDFAMQGDFDAVTAETGIHLYRITQEAIANALRHGGAKHISVQLVRAGSDMTLHVVDDGTGFEVRSVISETRQGVGLSSMFARAGAIGAQIRLERLSPKGFRVAVEWVQS